MVYHNLCVERTRLDRRNKKTDLKKTKFHFLIAPIKPTTHHKEVCVVMGLIGAMKLKKNSLSRLLSPVQHKEVCGV